MFGNTKAEDTKKTPLSSPSGATNALNSLVKGSAMEGTLKCESDLRVDGTIKGKLWCSAKLIIGPTGSIEGEVTCQNAVIEGTFKGTLQVAELLNIREAASVDGDISTNRLIVQSGARFNVACRMGAGAKAAADKTAAIEAKNEKA